MIVPLKMTERLAGEQALSPRRLNVGCGDHPLVFWTNLDVDENVPADVHARVPPLPFGDEALDDIYAGHFLEHLERMGAVEFLAECHRCLSRGGRLGVVVPDTREVMRRYLRGDIDEVEFPHGKWHRIADLDELCAVFLYSTVQVTPHRWSYDAGTLKRLLERCGFEIVQPIDRYADPRVAVGAWYQCGWDARKP